MRAAAATSATDSSKNSPRCFDQPIVVTYKAGAGGEIGWTWLVGAKADGYTIGGVDLPHIRAPAHALFIAFTEQLAVFIPVSQTERALIDLHIHCPSGNHVIVAAIFRCEGFWVHYLILNRKRIIFAVNVCWVRTKLSVRWGKPI